MFHGNDYDSNPCKIRILSSVCSGIGPASVDVLGVFLLGFHRITFV